MNDSLGVSLVLYALGLAAVCATVAVRGRPRAPGVTASLVVLEGAAVLQGVFDAVALVTGHHGPAVTTNLGYLVVSVAVLPVAGAVLRMDEDRWGTAGAAVACVLVAVLTVRLHATLAQHGV